MKAIMISDHAKWCALMMNGDKTIEVRKENVGKAVQKLIDENGYADIYVYCTKGKDLMFHNGDQYMVAYGTIKEKRNHKYNGKVIFKFRCYKVEEIKFVGYGYHPSETPQNRMAEKSCIYGFNELDKYLKGKTGCAIHISDLEIFDKPKELSEFYKVGYIEALENSLKAKPFPISPQFIQNQYLLRKAPQSFCYVEVEQNEKLSS